MPEKKGDLKAAISGAVARLARFSLKILTGQRDPPVAYILGLNVRSGTNSCSPIRVLGPRSVIHST